MGIFTRFQDIIASNVNAMLDKAENPEKMIRMMIREMEETLVELKANCAGTMAECKRIRRERDYVLEAVEKWEQRAELAIAKGREDLAREALIEKHREMDKVEALDRELAGCEALVAQAQEDLGVLESKLKATKEKQGLLVQRQAHAVVRKQARMDATRADGYDAVRRFEELEHRVERMEAEADVAGFPLRDGSLEARFGELEGSEQVERELAAMKERLGKGTRENS
ncbi:phage shock protein PspA [Desulfovibrio mangrovi]|uniref:phage shock protein PspA n=1 Tax=Desulfovibrio mangrovi TaxID=2976983 RepID=UPI002245C957|nr:phage shock protein PspA [Desulfovibrio mangrovi]UZP66143.1 phage shock protein PspA [Desulfovibrio mangrovi]